MCSTPGVVSRGTVFKHLSELESAPVGYNMTWIAILATSGHFINFVCICLLLNLHALLSGKVILLKWVFLPTKYKTYLVCKGRGTYETYCCVLIASADAINRFHIEVEYDITYHLVQFRRIHFRGCQSPTRHARMCRSGVCVF